MSHGRNGSNRTHQSEDQFFEVTQDIRGSFPPVADQWRLSKSGTGRGGITVAAERVVY